MAKNTSIYLHDDVLRQLDEKVASYSLRDKQKGLAGRRLSNRSSVIEEALREYFDRHAPLPRDVITYHVVQLAKEYGANAVSLFGSYARGEETAESDIDILLEKGSIKGMRVLDFQEELTRRLGRNVDVVTTEGASERLLGKIRADEVVLYRKEQEAL
jgi:predicted nucleotidyltransferase